MTRSRYRIFETEYPYFLTGTVVAWLPIFANPAFAEIIFDSWRFLQRERGIRIFGYVVMENHLHWIAAGDNLSERLGQFKSFAAGAFSTRWPRPDTRLSSKSWATSSCGTRPIGSTSFGRTETIPSRFRTPR